MTRTQYVVLGFDTKWYKPYAKLTLKTGLQGESVQELYTYG